MRISLEGRIQGQEKGRHVASAINHNMVHLNDEARGRGNWRWMVVEELTQDLLGWGCHEDPTKRRYLR